MLIGTFFSVASYGRTTSPVEFHRTVARWSS